MPAAVDVPAVFDSDPLAGQLSSLPDWVWIAAGVAVLALLTLVVVALRRRASRRRRLRTHFSSEYDRMLLEGRRRDVETALEERLDRRREIRATPVDRDEADRLRGLLDDLLVGFVDAPAATAAAAVEVAGAAAIARGYRPADGADRPVTAHGKVGVDDALDLASVDHPDPVAALRRAEQQRRDGGDGDGATERARRVVLAARSLVDLLLAAGGDVDVRRPLELGARSSTSDTRPDRPAAGASAAVGSAPRTTAADDRGA
ncbi:MAG: hypothetical protein ACLGIR_01450 [Actinomycetes bacterium]